MSVPLATVSFFRSFACFSFCFSACLPACLAWLGLAPALFALPLIDLPACLFWLGLALTRFAWPFSFPALPCGFSWLRSFTFPRSGWQVVCEGRLVGSCLVPLAEVLAAGGFRRVLPLASPRPGQPGPELSVQVTTTRLGASGSKPSIC